MRHVNAVVALLVAMVMAAGCGGDGGTTSPAGGDTGGSTTKGPATQTTGDDRRDGGGGLPGGELAGCTSNDGYSIAYPKAWQANDDCSRFDPHDPGEPGPTDARSAAITAYIDDVPFHEAAAPDEQRQAQRSVTAIDGLQAVRLRYEARQREPWPAGTPVSVYLIDLSPGIDDPPLTMFIDAVGLPGVDFEQVRIVLDRMARSVRITRDGVQTDRSVVARYEGAGGFRVEGNLRADEACLRIPPRGNEVCAAVPPAGGMHTVQLTDLEPTLAGVTGASVFEVRATRRTAVGDERRTSSVLTTPIGDGSVRGFAFTFGLDAVEQLTLHDIAGDRIDTVEPGSTVR